MRIRSAFNVAFDSIRMSCTWAGDNKIAIPKAHAGIKDILDDDQ